jgi:hypothetical protein
MNYDLQLKQMPAKGDVRQPLLARYTPSLAGGIILPIGRIVQLQESQNLIQNLFR